MLLSRTRVHTLMSVQVGSRYDNKEQRGTSHDRACHLLKLCCCCFFVPNKHCVAKRFIYNLPQPRVSWKTNQSEWSAREGGNIIYKCLIFSFENIRELVAPWMTWPVECHSWVAAMITVTMAAGSWPGQARFAHVCMHLHNWCLHINTSLVALVGNER